MAVKVRLARAGAKKRPFYRIIVADTRSPRDGKFIDQVGYYDPNQNPAQTRVDFEKLNRWLASGATPTEIVRQLIAKARKSVEEIPARS